MIGYKINQLLVLKNISREKFAEDMSFSAHTLQKILSNQRDCTTSEVEKIAKYLNVSPKDLEHSELKLIFENRDQSTSNQQGINYNDSNLALTEAQKFISTLQKDKDKLEQKYDTLIEKYDSLLHEHNALLIKQASIK